MNLCVEGISIEALLLGKLDAVRAVSALWDPEIASQLFKVAKLQ